MTRAETPRAGGSGRTKGITMKFWTTYGTGRRILHAQLGRWKLSARRGRFKFNLEREYPGTFVASFGPLFVTGLRQAKQKTPPGGGVSSGPSAQARGCDSPSIAGSEPA